MKPQYMANKPYMQTHNFPKVTAPLPDQISYGGSIIGFSCVCISKHASVDFKFKYSVLVVVVPCASVTQQCNYFPLIYNTYIYMHRGILTTV